jgi:hypothetical protein
MKVKDMKFLFVVVLTVHYGDGFLSYLAPTLARAPGDVDWSHRTK